MTSSLTNPVAEDCARVIRLLLGHLTPFILNVEARIGHCAAAVYDDHQAPLSLIHCVSFMVVRIH
jgi:hypothetical protein